jgi:hypothetical protein
MQENELKSPLMNLNMGVFTREEAMELELTPLESL